MTSTTLVPFSSNLDRSKVARILVGWRTERRTVAHDGLPDPIELPAFATATDIGRAIAGLNGVAERLGVSISADVQVELKDGSDGLPPVSLVVAGPTEAAQALTRGVPAVSFTMRGLGPTPDDLDARAARPAVSREWGQQTVDPDGAARVARDEAKAREFGLALPPAFFALGTTLVQIGVDAARADRHAFDAMPAADEAMRTLRAQINAEKREDLAIGLAALRVNANGKLCGKHFVDDVEQSFVLGVERDTMSKLCSIVRAELDAPGDLGVVTALSFRQSPDIVRQGAALWNHYALEVGRREEVEKERKTVVLRTREVAAPTGERRRQAYAVVSESYGEVDVHRVAEAIGRLPDIGLCKAEVFYDGARARVDVITQTTVEPEDQTVGDMHRLGFRVQTNDTGGGSLRLYTFAERIACINRTIVSAQGAELIIRHLGDTQRLVAKLREGLVNAHKAVRAFARQWTAAVRPLEVDAVEAAEKKERAAFAAMVERFQREADLAAGRELMDGVYRSLLLHEKLIPARKVEDTLPALRAAHYDPRNAMPGRDKVRGGLSRASVANGLTLWAQALPIDAAHDVEVLAGRIVSGEQPLSWLAQPVAR